MVNVRGQTVDLTKRETNWEKGDSLMFSHDINEEQVLV